MSVESPIFVNPSMPMPRGPAKPREGVTITGVLLFITTMLVFASAFKMFRPQIGGLLLHPFLVSIIVFAPITLCSRLPKFPKAILYSAIAFCAMYSFSCISDSIAYGEISKTWLALLTIVVTALWVRTRGDFIAGVVGLALSISLLAVFALQASEVTSEGINPMETANKNSYSLYALPAIYLAGFVALTFPKLGLWLKVLLSACVAIPVMAIAVSGNRSGWLGVAIVGVLLLRDRKIAGIVFIGMMSAIVAYWLFNYADTEVAERRINDTKIGRTSDELRLSIVSKCVAIGLENPVLGVSPQLISVEIAKRLQLESQWDTVDSHNVFGHVIAASGLICFAALLATGWAMWRWPMPPGVKEPAGIAVRQAASAVCMMIILWACRGFFSREIVYNPGFCIALGLIIGWRSVVTEQFKASRPPS